MRSRRESCPVVRLDTSIPSLLTLFIPCRLGTPRQHLAKGGQIGLPNAQEPSIAHRRQRPGANPFLDRALIDAQHLGDFGRGEERPDRGPG